MMKGNESRDNQCSSMLTRVPIKGPGHSVPDDPRPDLAEPFSQTGHRGLSAGSGSFWRVSVRHGLTPLAASTPREWLPLMNRASAVA